MSYVINIFDYIEIFNKEMRGNWEKRKFLLKNIFVRNSNVYMWFLLILIRVVFFIRYGDCYVWNKVITCIYNIFSGRRWIEYYGEVIIRNIKSSVCICKFIFVKVNNIL